MKIQIIAIFILVITLIVYIFIRKLRKNKKIRLMKKELEIFKYNIEKYDVKIQPISYPIYYINMDKDVHRREYVEKQLDKISNNYNRVQGIVGVNIPDADKKDIREIQGIHFINEYDTLTKGEIGCILSHIKAINTAYNNGDDIALICEDDIYTEPYKLSKPVEYIVENAPKDWELLQLFTLDPNRTFNYNNIEYIRRTDDYSFIAYIINRKGMEKVLSILGYPYHIRQINKGYPEYGYADYYINSLLTVYIPTPYIFLPNISFESTMHNDHIDKFHLPNVHKAGIIMNKELHNKIKIIDITPSRYQSKSNICILLTMYCNKDREKLYSDNVKYWITTGLPIFSVNSSGSRLNISSPNYSQYSFNQKIKFQDKNPSVSEKNSILQAMSYFKELQNYDLIFKVTGKYFLPELKNILTSIPENIDIVLQNSTDTASQNCEIFGVKPSIMFEILKDVDTNRTMEEALLGTVLTGKYRTCRLPPLKPYKKVARGDGKILDYL